MKSTFHIILFRMFLKKGRPSKTNYSQLEVFVNGVPNIYDCRTLKLLKSQIKLKKVNIKQNLNEKQNEDRSKAINVANDVTDETNIIINNKNEITNEKSKEFDQAAKLINETQECPSIDFYPDQDDSYFNQYFSDFENDFTGDNIQFF